MRECHFRCEGARKGPSTQFAYKSGQLVSAANSIRQADSGLRDLKQKFSSGDLGEGETAAKLSPPGRFGVECGFTGDGIEKN